MIPAVILVAIIVLVLFATYNGLNHLRHEVRMAWSSMDEQLKRRYDLVPILMTAVQGIGGEAAARLPGVSAAKNQAAVAFNPTQLAQAETALTTAIAQVFAAADQDPNYKANGQFADARKQIAANEKQIDQARRRYNDRVDALNMSITSFPCSITAKAVGLQLQPKFEI